MNDNVLVANQLCFSIGKTCIFQNFNLTIKQREIVSIIGANKCGKSTLIKLLSGFYYTENQITVSNISLNEKTKDGFFKKVGLVCTNYSEIHDKVKDYIESDIKKKDSSFYNEVMEMCAIKSLLQKRVDQLNCDDFVLVELCKNLVKKPNVLFIDYTNLCISEKLKKQIEGFYSFIKQEGIAIVFATNNASDILLSDTTYVLHKGVIALSGKTNEVLKQDRLLLNFGIELPFEVDLSLKLGMYNLIDDLYYDMDKLVEKLWK